jgi:hypothetical protein
MPPAITTGMYLAALAQAEACDIVVDDGALGLTVRYEPSEGLEAAFVHDVDALVGVLGWAVPLERPAIAGRGRCTVVHWRTRGIGAAGAWGRS